MALEISASRLIAPYFGTSLFVWTNVIGIVLLALSLGYYFGGKLAEARPHTKLLFAILAISGALISVIPFAVRPLSGMILETIITTPASIFAFIGSFFAVLILFALPIALLGAVSPFLIKLLSQNGEDVGATSGKLFALGTLGSMVGTFLPTLVLIPFIGTKLTITIFGAIIFIFGLYGLLRKTKWKFLFLLPLVLPFVIPKAQSASGLVLETESAYQHIRVLQNDDDSKELRFNEGLGIQSLWTPSGYVGHGYWDFPAAFFLLRENFPKRVAVLGLAAGTIPRSALLRYPDKNVVIDGVEIDATVIEVAKKYFELERSGLNIRNADARNFIKRTGNYYDLIFVDAYSNQLYIPFHLASREFFNRVRTRLTSKGVVVMNVNAVSLQSPLLTAIANTLKSEFEYVSIIPVPGSYNFLVLGSKEKIDFEGFKSRLPGDLVHVSSAVSNAVTWQRESNGRILTDDKAPVELLTDALIVEFLRKNFVVGS